MIDDIKKSLRTHGFEEKGKTTDKNSIFKKIDKREKNDK